MNHRRKTAAALTLALLLGLCGGHVLADGTPNPEETAAPPLLISPAPPILIAPAPGSERAPEADLPYHAGESLILEQGTVTPDFTPGEDEAGTVSFENLEERLREHNLNIRALDASIDAIEAVDLDEMANGLRMAVRMIRAQQEQLKQLVEGTSAALNGLQAGLDGMESGINVTVFQPALTAYPQATIATLETQIATYESTLKDLENGLIEEQYDSAVSQMTNAQHQIVLGGQTLYLSLLGLEQTAQGLQRSLAALDRTLAELDVRYEMGQISALTLAEAKAGRTSLKSGVDTLNMNLVGLRRQLEGMLGEEISGTIRLSPLTAVSSAVLDMLDYEEDLDDFMRRSLELDTARAAWDDARFEHDQLEDSPTAMEYEVDSARYNERSARLSYEATEQNLELKFAALYDKLQDQRQILAASRTALAVKEDSYAAAQIRFEQGVLSQNKLLDARDALEEARDAADTAAIDLFTCYNNYRWAVDHGILN